MELKTLFEEAALKSKTLTKKPDNDILLQLYSLYKQSTEGDLNIETPVNQPSLASSTPKEMSQSNTKPDNEGLLQLKQEALQSLAPMVHKLDQTPEEKFKTLMMLIQASDNTDLVKDAYETAKQITDEKDRAQALIDVVNEINYFTQHSNSDK